MIIKTYVDISQEIEVDISAEDIVQQLNSLPDDDGNPFGCCRSVNIAYSIIRKTSDEAIDKMQSSHRKVIREALLAQADRFK